MRTSDQTNEIAKACALAQHALKPAIKDATNPAFRSKYADLAAVVEAAKVYAGQGIAIWQDATTDENGVNVTTRLTHASGQWVEFGPYTVPLGKKDAHGVGSATTYAKRFALSAALLISADEDDDGNAAVAQKPHEYELPKPIGYDDWFTDLSALADTADVDTFRDSYKASQKKYRDYLQKHHQGDLDALVEKAKQHAASAA